MVKHDFLIIGAALVDLIATTTPMKRVVLPGKYVEHRIYLSLASKTSLKSVELSPGGSALNVAVTMDCMGSRNAFLTCIGKNVFGDFLLRKLKTTKINASYVKRVDTRTGIGINLISGGEKSCLVYHGAVDMLGPDDLSPAMVKNSRHILLTSITSRKNYALFLKILKLAKKYGVPVIFAPSITMLKAFKRDLQNLNYPFDAIILNYEEGSFLTHKKGVKQILKSLPARVAVVTKDREGAYAKEGSTFLSVNSLPVKIKNTTGAGDVFCGAFVNTYYKTGAIKEALKIATCVASMKLSKMEAEVQCFPPQVIKFLKVYEKKLRVRAI
ncbi:carbohydrate kinase family protein [Candidatus Woesearchaeota archaeon]|nr:carbohydrate kinase family protein [Candidatus Woesearchaeota archaeon]